MNKALEILVAIDLVDGAVVRLTKGEMAHLTRYGEDPAAVAANWASEGARWLHVVDLDRAVGSGKDNSAAITRILSEAVIPVEVGGGIRSIDEISRWISLGAARVCVGTKLMDKEFLKQALEQFGDRVVASIDARGGEVAIRGWKSDSGRSLHETAATVVAAGVGRIMFTDINRDGTLEGPNLEETRRLVEAVAVPVIASGGVAGRQDISNLAKLAPHGLEGVVVGRALYSGGVTLREALEAAEEVL